MKWSKRATIYLLVNHLCRKRTSQKALVVSVFPHLKGKSDQVLNASVRNSEASFLSELRAVSFKK